MSLFGYPHSAAQLAAAPLAATQSDAAQIQSPTTPLTEQDFLPNGSMDGPFGRPAKPNRCAAPNCTGSWRKLWRKRRTPLFEEDWGCSSACLETLVRSAVQREAGDVEAHNVTERHRHRVPLGLVLLAQGWITHPQLQAALNAQRVSGRGRIGDWLTQSCGLEEERITRGLGVQWGCPVLAADGFAPQPMALVMPRRFVAEFGLVPLRLAGSSLLRLAFKDRMDHALAAAVQQMNEVTVETGLLSASQYDTVREALLAAEAIPVQMSLLEDSHQLAAAIRKLIEQMQPAASRLVRVHQYYWLRMWMEGAAATDHGRLPARVHGIEDHLFMIGRQPDPLQGMAAEA